LENLSPQLYVPAIVILISLLSAAVGIIGYFLKDLKANQREKDITQDRVIEGVKDSLAEFKAVLPRQYVLRDDFIRAIAGLDSKIETVFQEVCEINKNLSRITGGSK
jgi:uncharacterized protein YoxC